VQQSQSQVFEKFKQWVGQNKLNPGTNKGGQFITTLLRSVRCYTCDGFGHIQVVCPNYKSTKTIPQAQVKRVSVSTVPGEARATLEPKPSKSEMGKEAVRALAPQPTEFSAGLDHGVESVKSAVQITKVVVFEFGDNNINIITDIINNMLPVCYMNVSIRCNDNNVRRNVNVLCDTGSEMSLVRSDLLDDIDYHVVGRVQLRPFCGNSISANVVLMNVANRMSQSNSDGVYLHCAVVSNLHDKIILAENAIARLSQVKSNVDRVIENSVSGGSDTTIDDASVSDKTHVCDVVVVQNPVSSDTPPSECKQTVVSDDVAVVLVKTNRDSLVSSSVVAQEQRDNVSLKGCFKLAEQEKGHVLIHTDLLYHQNKIFGHTVFQLVVPQSRRKQVLKMGHDTHGGYMGVKCTKERIAFTFYWLTLVEDCKEHVKTCKVCQLKKRVTYADRVPICPIPRADKVFDHWFIDCAGPFFLVRARNRCIIMPL